MMRVAVWGLAIGLLGGGGMARANSLLDAYHAAQHSDAVLESAAAARDAAVEAKPQARALLLPTLTANAAAEQQHYVLYDTERSTADADGETHWSGTGVDKSVSLDLTQPLWSVESFQKLRQASVQVAEAEAQYRDAEQSLILRVAEAYFAVLSAADNLSANRLERQAYGALVDQAQKKLQTGLGARIGVEEAQAFHSLTAQSVSDAELALFDARRALEQITGRPLPLTPLRDEIPLASPQPSNADEWLAAAREQNYAVQAAELAMEAARRGISVVRGRYWPSISLQGSVGRSYQPMELGNDERLDSIGVVAQWPIFQGGLVRSQSREAQAQYRQAQADYTARLRQAERDTLAAYRGVLGGIHTIRAARLAVQANRMAIEASKNGVEAGTRTEFDLLNAQNNYYAALRAYYQSRYDYLTNSLKLKAQAGRLGEADLAAVDAVLAVDGTTVSMPAEPAP
ncbi:MAG: TolC family outer membrane protein [Solimonas sp.]